MRSTRKVVFPKQDAVAKVRQQNNPRSAYHPQAAKSSTMAGAGAARYTTPSALSTPPRIRDSLVTATSAAQDKNIEETLPLIKAAAEGNRAPLEYNKYRVPRLDRLQHIDFLTDALGEHPARFVGIDASRPWMVYWGLMGLHLLGEDATDYRTRLVPPQLLDFGSCASLSRRLTRA
jgi:protein farnesyltransferase subunit beta